MGVATSRDVQMKMAEMVSVEVGLDHRYYITHHSIYDLDAVRDWLVCCHYNKKDADVFLRRGYDSINSIRTKMTQHDCERIQSLIPSGAFNLWYEVERLKDIPKDKIPQKLPVRNTRYLKLQDTSKSYKIYTSSY